GLAGEHHLPAASLASCTPLTKLYLNCRMLDKSQVLVKKVAVGDLMCIRQGTDAYNLSQEVFVMSICTEILPDYLYSSI
ncbi:unnamed protein product, partial [Urochloa humidicola]